MSLKPAHILLAALLLSAAVTNGWIWSQNPEKFALDARTFAVGFCVLIWFVLAYNVIEKRQKPGLGWAMVVIGISAVVFPYGRYL